ncbi:FtsH protease activity modulator HflK [Persicobacter diffluens]|uniref:Protein HflK n=1 Tax=Persicobacter diffluens TaxID=981 RepID=A0AAN4W130_9BACT|nr:HflK protein [Persicobacter diffluens]
MKSDDFLDFTKNEGGPILQFLKSFSRLIIIGILVFITFYSAAFKVGPEEVGVITRFGKYQKTVESGLNFKLPYIESVYKVAVERQQKLEFGFRTRRPDVRSEYQEGSSKTKDESLMLTGDLNLADVEWVVQYRIADAYKYLFKVRNPENSLRDLSEAAMREIVGDRTVNEVLTVGRSEIAAELQSLAQSLCNEYQLGIKIEQVVLQDVNPPESVKGAFNAVNEAQQQKETLINQAKSEYNKIIPKASGEAKETIQKAEGYATERINNALGEASRFNDLYAEYVKAPEITRQRIYLETMQEVLPKLGKKIITDENGANVLPLLQMNLDKSITPAKKP